MVKIRGRWQGPDAGAVLEGVLHPAGVLRPAGPPEKPPVGASLPVVSRKRRSSPQPRQPRPPSHPPTKAAAAKKAVENAAAIAAGANVDLVAANVREIARLQSVTLELRKELEAANEAVEAAGARALSGKDPDPDWRPSGPGRQRQR